MRMPSPKQMRSLERATVRYETQLPTVLGYLGARGITEAMARRHRLGVCSEPELGHESSVGRLAIPYTNRAGVIGIKFRCLRDHSCKAESCPRYLAPLGQEVFLFNVLAVEEDASTIHITEGELDAVVLAEVTGEPVVGCPGTGSWRPHHPWHMRGFERVLVWPDGDQAGTDWARMLRKDVSTAEIVTMPSGHDVTSLYTQAGADAIRRLAGDDDAN